MSIWVEVGLAALLALFIFWLWAYFVQEYGLTKGEKRYAARKKGVDSIGVAVICFCHDGKGKYLVEKRSQNTRDEQGNWSTGGGSVEFGEHIEDAVRREAREEYSTELLDIEFLGFRDVHRTNSDGQKTHWVVFDYRARVDPATVKIGEPDMTDELRWVAIADIPSPRHSQFAVFLEKYTDVL
jgi:8-oxo-dGTP diphosphatase